MIAVERRGRLGNQMFQFAFGLAASRRLGTDFAMLDDELQQRFVLGRGAGRLRRALTYRLARRFDPYPIVKVDNDAQDEPEDVLAALRDRTEYAGFFQSERYFAEVHDAVRAAFRPLGEHEHAFHARYGELAAGGYVCCHVRRTDYVDWRGGVALPASYYRDALRLARADAGRPLVFIGDDLEEAEAEFGALAGVRFEHNSDIVDLQLLVHASAVVTSNSSFGWWGAWLGKPRPIFAPRYWVGFRTGREWPHRVVPDSWAQVPV